MTLWMLLLLACAADPAPIAVRWYPSPGDEDAERARQALGWGLVNLGAVPRAWDETADDDGWTIRLDPGELGLGAEFIDAWTPLGASEEYARFGAVDVGRFLMRVAMGPRRYAAITGACPTLDGWQARLGETDSFTVTSSLLVAEERHLVLSRDRVAVSAAEEATDVLDLMANGQPRYAAYDEAGMLIPASTAGGPPGRCQWCHEDHLQPVTDANPGAAGDVSKEELDAWIAAGDAEIVDTQASLDTVVDLDTYEVHEWLETLLDAFLHPSPARVESEWGAAAPDLPTHTVEEWGWTDRLTRADVDAAWDGEAVPVMPEFRSYDPATDPEAGEMVGRCLE